MVDFALRLMSTCWLLSASITMSYTYTHTLYGQRPEIVHKLKLCISLNCKSWLHGKFRASKVCYTVLLKVSMRMVPIGYLNTCFPVGRLLEGLEGMVLKVFYWQWTLKFQKPTSGLLSACRSECKNLIYFSSTMSPYLPPCFPL